MHSYYILATSAANNKHKTFFRSEDGY